MWTDADYNFEETEVAGVRLTLARHSSAGLG
jgi:hypothetical protein